MKNIKALAVDSIVGLTYGATIVSAVITVAIYYKIYKIEKGI